MEYHPGFVSILVTGEMRSGTTLVTSFLNSQEHCVVYADFLRSLFREARKLGIDNLTAELSSREKNVLVSNLVAEGFRIGVSEFQEIKRDQFNTWLGLYWLALEHLDRGRGSQLVGTKATREYHYLSDLLEHDVRVIYCVRDPRDVLLSAKNRFSDYDMFGSAREWKRGFDLATSLQHHPKFMILRFENLLEDQDREEMATYLSQFLGTDIAPSPDSLIILDGVEFRDNSAFGDVGRPFDSNALYRWKKQPSSDEAVFAGTFFRDEIQQLGYEKHRVCGSAYRSLYRDYVAYSVRRWMKDVLLGVYHSVFG